MGSTTATTPATEIVLIHSGQPIVKVTGDALKSHTHTHTHTIQCDCKLLVSFCAAT